MPPLYPPSSDTHRAPAPRSLGKIFEPFSAQVWIVHFFFMAVVGLAILVMEATAHGLPPPVTGGPTGAVAHSLDSALRSIHASVLHFLFYSPRHRPSTPGGRLALAALAFHVLVMSASYQAALAGLLATSAPLPTEVGSFGAVEHSALPPRPQGRVCMLEAVKGLFPTLDPTQVVGMDSYGPLYERLRQGWCGSAVTGLNDYLIYVQARPLPPPPPSLPPPLSLPMPLLVPLSSPVFEWLSLVARFEAN